MKVEILKEALDLSRPKIPVRPVAIMSLITHARSSARYVSTRLEQCRVGDRGLNRARDDRPDAGYGLRPPARLVRAMPNKNCLIESYDPRLKVGELLEDRNRRLRARAECGGLVMVVGNCRQRRQVRETLCRETRFRTLQGTLGMHWRALGATKEPAQDDTPGISNAVDLKDMLRKGPTLS
jgi:hypothetical protein